MLITTPPSAVAEDREFIVLVLGLLVASFVIGHLSQIRKFPWWPLPVLASGCLLGGWAASVVEDFYPCQLWDIMEHSLYVSHSVLLCIWAARLSRGPINA